jgi:hypothetical protein
MVPKKMPTVTATRSFLTRIRSFLKLLLNISSSACPTRISFKMCWLGGSATDLLS